MIYIYDIYIYIYDIYIYIMYIYMIYIYITHSYIEMKREEKWYTYDFIRAHKLNTGNCH